MSEAKHTPGPWTVDLSGPFILGGDSVSVEATDAPGRIVYREICNVLLDTGDGDDENPDLETDLANARLIAAGPELLEACKAFLGGIDSGIVWDMALAAIRKAEGRDS